MSDELNHRRNRPVVLKPISEISVDPSVEIDPRIVSQLVALAKGKISVGYTRLDERRITSGFFKREGEQTHHVTQAKTAHLPGAVATIRAGGRPLLDIYWQAISPHESKLICPDDELFLAAYRELGIHLVPCRIIKPVEAQLDESAIVFRMAGKRGRFVKAIAKDRTHLEALVGSKNMTVEEAFAHLISSCAEVRKSIRAFHRPLPESTHYHEVLHAVVLRHEQTLSAILALVNQGFGEHALALVRLAYEGLLNFYIDWLSPELMGPRLQLLSAVRNDQRSSAPGKSRFNDTHLDVLDGLVPLLETVQQKGRISPLGDRFHALSYPSLSFIVHQDYGLTERDAGDFGAATNHDPAQTHATIVNWLDVITASLLSRIADDVGDIREG